MPISAAAAASVSMRSTNALFRRLVAALKTSSKTLTVVEQTCGGLINASIMAQPGASSVYYGGSVAYNTNRSKPFLCNDERLHADLVALSTSVKEASDAKKREAYIQSKLDWTARASVAFCESAGTDFCIAEGGAAGPMFRLPDMDQGFTAITIAGKCPELNDGSVRVLQQQVIHSSHADREANMDLFRNAAVNLALETVVGATGVDDVDSTQENSPCQPSKALELDRATKLRSQPDALEELQKKAKHVVLRGREVLVDGTTKTQPAYLTYGQVVALGGNQRQSFLGQLSDSDKTPVFGVDFLKEEEGTEGGDAPPPLTDVKDQLDADVEFVDTRTTAPLFSPIDNELVLHATALGQWQRRSAYCTMCGSPTTLIDGGTARYCGSCKAPTWPRQDPSIIVGVSSRDGERLLLARSKRHPRKVHTVLAGFVEAGETYEAAVARETFEETGVIVDEESAEYIASQPWPFPQSSMIAFLATADDTTPINIDPEEIVSASWYNREEVEKAGKVKGTTMQHAVAEKALEADPSLTLLIPPAGVVARTLIDIWLER